MTRTGLLQSLKDFTEDATKDLLLPVRRQKSDAEEPADRQAKVYMTRLPEMKASENKAPYIVHSIITGRDAQTQGEQVKCMATVRSTFCVYNQDEETGGLDLLNLTERLRIGLLKKIVVGAFEMDMQQGIELLVYPDDTSPYYLAEMVTTWKLPPIKREVKETWL